MNGQLMILDLIEHLEQIPGFELIQSNTDGLIISIPEDDVLFERVDDICYEWEKRCRMELEFDEIEWICQKDVNNYVFKFKDGGLERKGSYVKELSPLDYDLPIVNEAVVNYIAGKKPVKDTINECDELIKFQKVVKLSRKYDFVLHNDRKYNYKCYRVFASNDSGDGAIYKCRANNNPAKFGNTPDKCFIDNSSVENKKVPKNLDRDWYISLAEKRIKDFGM